MKENLVRKAVPPERAVVALPGYPAEIGRGLWAMEECRQRTLRSLKGITPEAIDRVEPPQKNSIGSLLYHIAAIEMDWLCVEILEMQRNFPPEVQALLPYPVKNEQGLLTPAAGVLLEAHLERLRKTREIFLTAFRNISLSDFYHPRILPKYTVTPEWVLYHLIQHESQHRGQIITLRNAAEWRVERP